MFLNWWRSLLINQMCLLYCIVRMKPMKISYTSFNPSRSQVSNPNGVNCPGLRRSGPLPRRLLTRPTMPWPWVPTPRSSKRGTVAGDTWPPAGFWALRFVWVERNPVFTVRFGRGSILKMWICKDGRNAINYYTCICSHVDYSRCTHVYTVYALVSTL